MVNNSRARVDDSSLRITVNNDQFQSTSVREYNTGIFHQLPAFSHTAQEPPPTKERHFQETVPASQYKQPMPVPPVEEIVQQTGHLLSQVDNWNPISLQPRPDIASASAATQSAVSQPVLVNISNSKCANLDASSSLAQNLLRNISLLGKAFSSSSVTYNPNDSVASVSGSAPSSGSTSYFARGTGYGDRVSASSGQVSLPASTKQTVVSTGERLSLKYCQPQSASSGAPSSSTAKSSACDPVIAGVLKSIGFNFDLSKFGSTLIPQQREQSRASSLQYVTVAKSTPQPVPPVQGYNPLQSSQNLTTPLKASTITAYHKIKETDTFSEIDKVLQKVREHSRTKVRSPSPVKERTRSRSRHRSLESIGDRSPVRKSTSSSRQLERKPRSEKRKRSVEETERRSGRDEIRRRASPSPRRHDIRAGKTSERKSRSARSTSPSPHNRPTSNVLKRRISPHREKVPPLRSISPKLLQRKREKARAAEKKRKDTERRSSPRSSPSTRQHDTRGVKSSRRKSHATQSPSLSAHSLSTFNAYKHWDWLTPPMDPYCTPYVQKNREDIEWERNTEAFLRKLAEEPRPPPPPALPSHRYRPGGRSDLSSVSSGSFSDYIDVDVDDGDSKPVSTPPMLECQDTVEKMVVDTVAELQKKVEEAKSEDKTESKNEGKTEQTKVEDRSEETKQKDGTKAAESENRTKETKCDDGTEATKSEDGTKETKSEGRAKATKSEDRTKETKSEGGAKATKRADRTKETKCDDGTEATKSEDRTKETKSEGRSKATESKDKTEETKHDESPDAETKSKLQEPPEPSAAPPCSSPGGKSDLSSLSSADESTSKLEEPDQPPAAPPSPCVRPDERSNLSSLSSASSDTIEYIDNVSDDDSKPITSLLKLKFQDAVDKVVDTVAELEDKIEEGKHEDKAEETEHEDNAKAIESEEKTEEPKHDESDDAESKSKEAVSKLSASADYPTSDHEPVSKVNKVCGLF